MSEQPISSFELRTWDQCAARAVAKSANPLDVFIVNNEPDNEPEREQFRSDLKNVIIWLCESPEPIEAVDVSKAELRRGTEP